MCLQFTHVANITFLLLLLLNSIPLYGGIGYVCFLSCLWYLFAWEWICLHLTVFFCFLFPIELETSSIELVYTPWIAQAKAYSYSTCCINSLLRLCNFFPYIVVLKSVVWNFKSQKYNLATEWSGREWKGSGNQGDQGLYPRPDMY